MTFVITKTINGRFIYWWSREKQSWQGLRDNADGFEAGDEVREAIANIRRKNLYDNSVCAVLGKRIKKNIKGDNIINVSG